MPDIEILDSAGHLTAVEIPAGLGSYVPRFDVGFESQWYEFDYPSENVSYIATCRVKGRILIEGEECIEVTYVCRNSEDEITGSKQMFYATRADWVFWIGQILHSLKQDTPDIFEKITSNGLRRHIKRGDEWIEEYTYRCGKVRRRERVEGVARNNAIVKIDDKEYQCLHIRSLDEYQPENGEIRRGLSETFIDERGYDILYRRYAGPGFRPEILERLADAPSIKHNGQVWKLLYTSVREGGVKL